MVTSIKDSTPGDEGCLGKGNGTLMPPHHRQVKAARAPRQAVFFGSSCYTFGCFALCVESQPQVKTPQR